MQGTVNTMGEAGLTAGAASWSSRFAFLMASVGFAVGLGNIWRFPYMTGENGGAVFVLLYLVFAFGIGAPILMAELLLGRKGKMAPPGTMKQVAISQRRSPQWRWVGAVNLLTAFLIMAVYCVIAGWVLSYFFSAVLTGFSGFDGNVASTRFDLLLSDSVTMLIWTLLGLLLTGAIIYAGVDKGIERAVVVLMPLLFVLLVLLAAYNVVVGGMPETIDYLFGADLSKLTPGVALAAVGQAFFSVGVAMAGMMTYGAYLPASVSIPRSVALIVFADTLVALMAGLVIFPAIFSNGLDPAGGPGLIFKTLPMAFAQMPGGHWVAALFFLLLSVAAITSMVGLIEPLTRWLEEYKGYTRHKGAVVVLAGIALLSIPSILGYNVLADFTYSGYNINTSLDYIANQLLLPLGGLLIAVFTGWRIRRSLACAELGLGDGLCFRIWYFLIRYVAPAAIVVILVSGTGE